MIYSILTDEQLLADIAQYQAARRELLGGGTVAAVAGEGRRIEYTRVNQSSLEAELKNLIAEALKRGLLTSTECGGAITAEFHG